jgi:hypothetical protein
MMTNTKPNYEIIPYRNDILFLCFKAITNNRPWLMGIYYFLISFAGVYLVGLFTGQLHGKNGLLPMYDLSRLVDNINIGFLAPVGAGLLCYLYNTIQASMKEIGEDGILPQEALGKYRELLYWLEGRYNNRWIAGMAFVLSLAVNLFNYFLKPDSWLGINGGVTGIYGRIFIFFNFNIIALIVYKCAMTVWALHKILQLPFIVRPMHPDRSGGLRSIGQLAFATNSFLVLLLAFFTILITFDTFVKTQPIYICIVLLFYLFAPFSIFFSLGKAHQRMAKKKEEILRKLSLTFDEYYQKMIDSGHMKTYELKYAADIESVSKLYDIVDKMPVWPFDFSTVLRFFTSIAIPLAVFIKQSIIDDNGWQTIVKYLGIQ